MFKDLVRLLKDTFEFFFANFSTITLLILPVILPVTLIGSAVEHFWLVTEEDINSQWARVYGSLAFMNLLAYPLYHAALVRFMHDRIHGQPSGIAAYYIGALSVYFPLLMLNLLIGFSVLAGLLLLIIPGLILVVRMTFAEFFCVLEQKRPLQAFKASWHGTKSDFWLIINGAAILYASLFVLEWAISQLLGSGALGFVGDTILGVIFGILYTLFTVFSYRMYVRHTQLSQQEADSEDDVIQG